VSDQRATLFDQRAAITVCVTLAALLDHCIDHRNADAVTQKGGKGHPAGSVGSALEMSP
jgi:hypothetical protein